MLQLPAESALRNAIWTPESEKTVAITASMKKAAMREDVASFHLKHLECHGATTQNVSAAGHAVITVLARTLFDETNNTLMQLGIKTV